MDIIYPEKTHEDIQNAQSAIISHSMNMKYSKKYIKFLLINFLKKVPFIIMEALISYFMVTSVFMKIIYQAINVFEKLPIGDGIIIDLMAIVVATAITYGVIRISYIGLKKLYSITIKNKIKNPITEMDNIISNTLRDLTRCNDLLKEIDKLKDLPDDIVSFEYSISNNTLKVKETENKKSFFTISHPNGNIEEFCNDNIIDFTKIDTKIEEIVTNINAELAS